MSWLVEFLEKCGTVPKISATERAALEAGSGWLDGELFSGKPDLEGLLGESDAARSEPKEHLANQGPRSLAAAG